MKTSAIFSAFILLAAPLLAAIDNSREIPEHGAVSNSPATQWEYAFLSGNGHMGALFWGEPGSETVTVSHARLFLPLGSNETVPDLGAQLPELRKILQEKGYGAGVRFMMEKAKPQGYERLLATDPFHPGFEFQIKTTAEGKTHDYLRTENFASGEVTTRWSDRRGEFRRRLFVSRPDNLVVLSLTSAPAADGQPAPLVSCEVGVAPIADAQVRAWKQNRNLRDDTPDAAANTLIHSENTTEPGRILIHNTYKYGKGGYDVGLRIVLDGGHAESDGKVIKITDAREVLILMRIAPFTPTGTSDPAALEAALASVPADYAKLLAKHAVVHAELFNRVKIDLGGGADRQLTTEELLARAKTEKTMSPALVEKMYDGSRYTILCATGERPPNLQGIWAGTWQPSWSGDYTTNTNLQLALAHLLSAGTPELLQGFFSLIDDSLPDWRINAKNFYGARGVMAPTRESNYGKMLHWSDQFDGLFWTCGAGWLAHWYYDYYLYTGDKKFLAEKTVPLLKEVALFYEDFLFIDQTGHYRFSPSNSAENGSGDNSTQDILVAHEVLNHLISAYRELGIDQASAPAAEILKWQAMLAKLPPCLVNDQGELQEWSLPGAANKNNHRHMSHLYAIFQSYEFDPETTPALWKASEKAYEARLNTWFRNPENSADKKNHETASHGRMHLSLCAARFGRGEDIWEIFTRMAGYGSIYPSLATAHYEKGAVFNMDANGGIPEVIDNALVFSLPGKLDLLPALPQALGSGEIRGLLARGQIKLNRLKWSPGSVEVELVSGKDQSVVVRVPKAAVLQAFDATNAKTAAASSANARTVELKANQSATLRISWQ